MIIWTEIRFRSDTLHQKTKDTAKSMSFVFCRVCQTGIKGARTCAQHLIMHVTVLSPPSLPQKRANLPCAQVRRRHSRRFRHFPTARDVSEPFSQTYNTFVAPSLWRSSPRLHQSKPKTNHYRVKVVLGFSFLISSYSFQSVKKTLPIPNKELIQNGVTTQIQSHGR